jgi:hypothetical protein
LQSYDLESSHAREVWASSEKLIQQSFGANDAMPYQSTLKFESFQPSARLQSLQVEEGGAARVSRKQCEDTCSEANNSYGA